MIWVSIAVFAAAAVAGARLPVPRRLGRELASRRDGAESAYDDELDGALAPAGAADIQMAPDFDPEWAGDEEDLAAFRPIADTEVILALMPMSVLKALVGFTTFLFAFGLRRDGRGHLVVRLRAGRAHRRRPDRSAAGVEDPSAAQRAADADRLAAAGGRR